MANSSILTQGFDQPYSAILPPTPPAASAVQNRGFLNKIANFGIAAGKGLVSPITDITSGIATDIAAGSNNKTVRDYAIQQQKGYTLKKAAGDELQLAALLLPAAKVGVAGKALIAGKAATPVATAAKVAPRVMIPRIESGALQGAGFGAGSELSNNGSAEDVLRGTVTGGVLGGAIGAGGGMLSKVLPRRGVPTSAPPVPGMAPVTAAPASRQMLLDQFRAKAAAQPIATAPQVVSKEGPTVLTTTHPAAPAVNPAPGVEAATEHPAIKAYDAAGQLVPAPDGSSVGNNPLAGASDQELIIRNMLANARVRAPQVTPISTAPAAGVNPLANASDEELMVRNYLDNAASRAPQPGATTPAAQPDLQTLFSESQGKINQALERPVQANQLHSGPEIPRQGPTLRPTTAPTPQTPFVSSEDQAAKMGLPEGYSIGPTGDVLAPSGKTLNGTEIQQLSQPRFLNDFENARINGDVATMQKISSAHPGDYRVSMPSPIPGTIGEHALSPATPELATNPLQKIGRGLERGAVKIDLPSSPYAARRAAELQQFMRTSGLLKMGANPQSISNKLPSMMDASQAKINQLIAGDTSKVASADLKAEVKASIAKENSLRGTDNKSKQIINNINQIIDKTAGEDGNLGASDIYNLKQMMNKDLDAAYKRLEKGGALSQTDQTIMAARDIINNKLPAAARAEGQKESNLHDIATVVQKDAREGAKLPKALTFGLPHFRQSRGLAHAMQSVMTGVGVPIEKLGNALAGEAPAASSAGSGVARAGLLGRAMSPVRSAVNNPVVQDLAGPAGIEYNQYQESLPSAPQQAPADMNSRNDQGAGPQPLTPGQNLQFDPSTGQLAPIQSADQQQGQGAADTGLGITSDQIAQAMLEDYNSTGGQNISKLNSLYGIVKAQEDALAKQNQPQSLNQTAVNQINAFQQAQTGLAQIQDAFNSTTGTGKGLLSKVLAGQAGAVTGLGNNVAEVNKTIQANLPAIAKALGMGTSTAELRALAAQLPNTSDTQKSATTKLNTIMAQINQYQNQFLTNQSNYVQPTNDTLSALAQMSAGGVQQ